MTECGYCGEEMTPEHNCTVKWIGNETSCDICRMPFGEFFIDGATIYGPWALMCEDCHAVAGKGLGLGKGQKYNTETRMKVEG